MSSLRDLFAEFASQYPSARKESLKGHPTADLMRKRIAGEISGMGVFGDGYMVRGSVGKGGWAEIPWAAVFDLEETDTLHHGLFVIFIYSADMRSLFLCLDQGSVTYFDSHGRAETNRHLEENSAALLEDLDTEGFDTGRIDLKATSSVGRFLENGCVCSRMYDVGDLPSDDRIRADLADFKDLYARAIEAERRLGLDMAIPGRRTVVPVGFFRERDAVAVARAVIGMFLCCRKPDGTVLRRRITETEAYIGEDDTAAHARFGRTGRNRVLYEDGGRAYVYRCYMFWLLNLTAGGEGDPQCVLVRGVEGAEGPGKASELMGFRKDMYGNALDEEHGLWLEDDGLRPGIESGPRVGIPYASEADRSALLNFRLRPQRRSASACRRAISKKRRLEWKGKRAPLCVSSGAPGASKRRPEGIRGCPCP
jgi:DNA-3-methyladenine glycosylase